MNTFYILSLHSSFPWCSPPRGCSGDAGSVASVLKWPTKEVFGTLPARIPLIPFLSVDILPSSPCTKLDDRKKEKIYLTKKQNQRKETFGMKLNKIKHKYCDIVEGRLSAERDRIYREKSGLLAFCLSLFAFGVSALLTQILCIVFCSSLYKSYPQHHHSICAWPCSLVQVYLFFLSSNFVKVKTGPLCDDPKQKHSFLYWPLGPQWAGLSPFTEC